MKGATKRDQVTKTTEQEHPTPDTVGRGAKETHAVDGREKRNKRVSKKTKRRRARHRAHVPGEVNSPRGEEV